MQLDAYNQVYKELQNIEQPGQKWAHIHVRADHSKIIQTIVE